MNKVMTIRTQVEYDIYDWQGNKAKKTSLDLKISEDTAKYIVHRAILKEQNNHKQSTSSTKTRSEVRGGGKKPWKQKGTGRARAGSSRSPLWRGGGVTFGPRPRIKNLKMNRKEWKLALRTALYNRSNNITVIESFNNEIKTTKTKSFINALKQWNISPTKKTLLVTDNNQQSLNLSIRNIPNVKIIAVNKLTVTDLLKSHSIIMTINALSSIQEVYND
uniref:ribosomal protein L4 n=1 Tax=Erythrolobus coxiae TaxID=362235 RepID=UPI001FCDA214|nr:ribosomal protein L4 [Erythrolobus coxiae]UNJ17734.1 ribosomal protein L4 [Erythrolobus coxiae]